MGLSSKSMPAEPRILTGLTASNTPTAHARAVHAQPAPRPARKLIAAMLMLLVAAGIVFGGYTYLSTTQKLDEATPDTRQASAPAAAQKDTPAPADTTDTAKPTNSASAEPPAASLQAAEIVNETATAQGKLSSALEAGVKPPPATLEKALARNVAKEPTPKAATATATVPAIAVLVNKKPTAATVAPATQAVKPPATAAATAAKAAPAAAAGFDKDVTLLAAVVTHINTQAAIKTPVTGKTDAASAAAGPDAIEQLINKESVEAKLKRCSLLGFLEGELCRMTTCFGQSDKEPACKSMTAKTTP